MTWEQYWYGDVRMTRSFYEAYRLRKKEENERLWLQGAYFFDGLNAALTNFGNALAGSKRKQMAEYAKKPYEIFKEPLSAEDKQAEEQRKIQEQRRKMHDYLDGVVKAYKAQRKEQEIETPM